MEEFRLENPLYLLYLRHTLVIAGTDFYLYIMFIITVRCHNDFFILPSNKADSLTLEA